MRFAKNLNFVPRSKSVRHGFTLVELMTVIAIISILVGLVVGGVAVAGRKSAEAKVKAQMAMIEIAFSDYQQKVGYFPQMPAGSIIRQNLIDLNTLYGKPLLDLTKFQFINNELVDAWENPYQYQCPGTHNLQTYDLMSFGPKRYVAGSTTVFVPEDDINNWSRN